MTFIKLLEKPFKESITIVSLVTVFMFGGTNKLFASIERLYPNEQAIIFKNGEQSVKAFEGSIQVLENRNNPSSRLIPVKYVRFPATGKVKGSPIIYLSGGPGGSGIAMAKIPRFRFPLFMALREFGDVIALDQRGTGRSKIVQKCHSNQLVPLNQVFNEIQVENLYREAAKECVSFWQREGVDVLGYTSIQSAMDIDELRQHLNAEKVILWGISYGSHLALASLKVMPGKIDKMIIASAEGLDQTVKLPARTDAYFARLQVAINKQSKSAKAYPDITALIRRVHKQLAKSPISLKLSKKNGSKTPFLFQSFHMQGIASAMIADPHRGVPKLLSFDAFCYGYSVRNVGKKRSPSKQTSQEFIVREIFEFSNAAAQQGGRRTRSW